MALEDEQRHVWYLADLCAGMRNKMRTETTDRVWSAEDLLRVKYRLPRSVMLENSESETDHGASGNWQVLRGNLKGEFEE